MEHQPFETWIITNEQTLAPDQEVELQKHLSQCASCQQLKNSWSSVNTQLTTAGLAEPEPGFSARFRSSLAARRAVQQQLQVRRVLLGLGSAGIFVAILLSAYLVWTSSPISILVSIMEVSLRTFSVLNTFGTYLFTWLTAVPLSFPLVIWILMSTGFALAVAGWLFTMWRISTQGVNKK